MKTQISAKALIMSPRDETLLFETNLKHTTIRVSKRIKWDRLLDNKSKWTLTNICQTQTTKNNEAVISITQLPDGLVELLFT